LYGNANPVNFTDPSGLYSIAEANAAASIGNTLNGIQLENLGYIISATASGGDYDGGDFARDFSINLGANVSLFFFEWTLKNFLNTFASHADSIRVYRVESEANARVLVGTNGEVIIQGDGTLFLNFGQRSRAEEFLIRRNRQYPDTPSAIKSFEVPKSYVDEIRANAVPERNSRRRVLRGKPIRVDERQAPDQYGLRTADQIEQLRRMIIQGTGRIES
jgi:hypothetical protein